jgi:pyruvate kinase
MWGVQAASMRRHEVTEALIADATARVVELGGASAASASASPPALPSGKPGTTSMFQVQEV